MDYWIGFCVGLFSGVYLGFACTSWNWQSDLINRGLAQYCPDTGEWAFKGECEE
jgi:hypothetical protein